MSQSNIHPDSQSRQGKVLLADFPEAQRTAALCLEAVKKDGAQLVWVPMELRTPELCLEAVKQNCFALQDVPASISHEMCIAAMNSDDRQIAMGQDTPELDARLELVDLAMENSGWTIDPGSGRVVSVQHEQSSLEKFHDAEAAAGCGEGPI